MNNSISRMSSGVTSPAAAAVYHLILLYINTRTVHQQAHKHTSNTFAHIRTDIDYDLPFVMVKTNEKKNSNVD